MHSTGNSQNAELARPADSTYQGEAASGVDPRPPATFADYVAIARPDHWIKHLFIVPGIALVSLLRPVDLLDRWWAVLVGFASAAAIASANYAINEFLDARFDALHPTKSQRPAVLRRLSRRIVLLEYAGLLAIGLAAAWLVSAPFFLISCLFAVSGIVYNVPPLRTKDRAYLDVISESFNNPLRLALGWTMLDAQTLPPGSVLLAYWMGGAFLMAVKRVAEQRAVIARSGVEVLEVYRRSFRHYKADSLLVSSFVYAQLSAFFLAVFLVKYRIEYLLALPLIAALFGLYFRLGLADESAAQTPERLIRERRLILMVVAVVVAMVLLTVFDIPALERLTTPHYIGLASE